MIGQNQCMISYSLYVYKVTQVIAAVNPWVDRVISCGGLQPTPPTRLVFADDTSKSREKFA